jgi:hypothetical protein
MRLTASLPTFTLLRASVMPAILRVEIRERYIFRGSPPQRPRSSACSAPSDLRDELALAVARHLQALDLARRC